MKISDIAYKDVFGISMVVWGGLLSLALLLLTFLVGALNRRGIRLIPLKYHFPLAWITVVVASVHGIIGLLANMGF